MLAKPSSNLLQRTGGNHWGSRAQPGWRTFMMTCLRWMLGNMRLEIWCKVGLSGDRRLCTALRTRSGACYCWIGVCVCACVWIVSVERRVCWCRAIIFRSWAWTTCRRRWWTCTVGRRSTRRSADSWWWSSARTRNSLNDSWCRSEVGAVNHSGQSVPISLPYAICSMWQGNLTVRIPDFFTVYLVPYWPHF